MAHAGGQKFGNKEVDFAITLLSTIASGIYGVNTARKLLFL